MIFACWRLDDIRKYIKDNEILIISVQSKELKGHTENLKEKLNYTLKEANDTKLDQKEEKYQGINLQERMGKKS